MGNLSTVTGCCWSQLLTGGSRCTDLGGETLTASDTNTTMGYFRFKSLLASFGPDGNPKKEIEISDVKYNIFQVTFIFLNQRKKKCPNES